MNSKSYNKWVNVAFLLQACSFLHIAEGAQVRLADHLVPPLPPRPPLHASPFALPLQHVRIPQTQQRFPTEQQHATQSTSTNDGSDGGFMTRIARWFGYGQNSAVQQQQLVPSTNEGSSHAETKNSYHYAQPTANHDNSNGKPCNICNKYPWVPMLPPQHQQPYNGDKQQHQQQQSNQWVQVAQNLDVQASQNYFHKQPLPANIKLQQQQQQQQQPPIRQRAKQFNFNVPPNSNYNGNPYLNLPLPPSPIQMLPFTQPSFPLQHQLGNLSPQNTRPPSNNYLPTPVANQVQQLPTTEHVYFNENVGAQSELQPNHLLSTQIPPTTAKDASFEIVRSHQITDFVSSVEYPASFVQSHAVDVMLESKKQNIETTTVATVEYPYDKVQPNLRGHTPASQILTDPNSLAKPAVRNCTIMAAEAETTVRSQYYEETTTMANLPPFEAQSLVISNFYQQQQQPIYEETQNHPTDIYGLQTAVDNFPSASSHNFSHVNDYQNILEGWTQQPYDYIETTTVMEPAYETTQQPYQVETTTRSSTPQYHRMQKTQRDRETPKRLLLAPIQYKNGGKNDSRSVTRDPSSLNFRFGSLANQQPQEFHYPNHAYPEAESSTTAIFVTPQPTSTSSTTTSPTSGYGALDASGQFAGISPPAPPPKSTTYQVVVPYTTKSRPRPFEPTNSDGVSGPTVAQKWIRGSNTFELHEQQESKLVKSATEIPPNSRRTKYLTKILAKNLRELLHRERESKRKTEGFDITKLQKNIDVWTEQEYTSLSHRASTPTIRGRSKHIPTEYLTSTTPKPRKSKTTSIFQDANLSTSINNLENVLRSESSKRFNFVPIDDNRLLDIDKPSVINEKFAFTTSTTPRTTTARTKSTVFPTSSTVIASLAPKIHLSENRTKELWRKTKVYISPQTKEKIYVVTPQPLFFPQRRYLESADNSHEALTTNTSAPDNFKSPRFSVRPTPGSSKEKSLGSEYRAQLFGLMGLSSYVPERPVEIIDGNSKVVTIVTPPQKPLRGSFSVREGSKSSKRNQPIVESAPR